MRSIPAFILMGATLAAAGCCGGSKPAREETKAVAPTAAESTPAAAAPTTTPAAGVEVCREERWIMIDLTAEQRRAYDEQVEANRRRGGYTVAVDFTPAQLEAIRRAFPACRETAITWDERCIFEYRALLRFDAQDKIITPAAPYTSR